jgi:hypothetical protein
LKLKKEARMKKSNFLHLLTESHRGLHFVCGLLLGLFFGIGGALCAAGALEFKDCQHDGLNVRHGMRLKRWTWRCWDWWDFGLTVAGGLLGSAIRWMVVGRLL